MKKTLMLLLTLTFLTQCKNVPEGNPNGGQSIISASEGDKVLLRLKPKVGQSQTAIMSMDVTSSGQQAITMNTSMNLSLNVTDFKDSIYTYEMNFTSIKMDMDGGGMSVKYNSNDKEQTGMSAMIHGQMKGLTEKPIIIQMTDRAKIKDVKIDTEQQAGQQGMNLGSMSVPLPEEPVGVGDSWQADQKVDGNNVMKLTMTVTKITVGDVVLDIKGTFLGEGNLGKESGGVTGTYTLDRVNGFTKDGVMNMSMNTQGQNTKIVARWKAL